MRRGVSVKVKNPPKTGDFFHNPSAKSRELIAQRARYIRSSTSHKLYEREKLQYLDFKSGKGVRFLTQLGQGMMAINNTELFYNFQGLTSDGKYYLAAVLPVSHPELPAGPEASGQPAMEPKDFADYVSETVTLLNQQPAGSFTPDLNELDALTGSIEAK